MEKDILSSVKRILSPNKAVEKSQLEISAREAHSLWTLLADRYIIIDQLNLTKNFSHDKDYIYFTNKHVERIIGENKILEGFMSKYSITPPQPNARDMNLTGNTEAMRDRVSAHLLYGYLRGEVGILAQTLRDALLNDEVRDFLTKLFKTNLQVLDDYIVFLKLKDWINLPPAYQYSKAKEEQIAINEIYLLWDHLVSRYTHIRLTQIAVSFSTDMDFKAIVETGLNILVKQADDLEKKLLNFGITLPEHFTNITITPQSSEIIQDRFIYATILDGMKNATSIHALASSEVITNDKLRKYFMKLTFEELIYTDRLIKYGKLKGWIPIPPKFKMGVFDHLN